MSEIIVKLNSDHIKIKGGEYVADLVRCKECRYWKAYETWSECERWTDDPYETAKTNADDFCSYGERREP